VNIAFVDLSELQYRIDALDDAPLGGSQSAMLLVARELARAGARVCVIGMNLEHGAAWGGVTGYNVRQATSREVDGVDAVVSVNFVPRKESLKRMFPRGRPRVIHWHKNDVLSPYGERFAQREFTAHLDHIVFCSHFQASGFLGQGGLSADRVTVIPNPVAPCYVGLIPPEEPILALKDPDLLIYASSPNRGLEGLLKIVYPELRKSRPRLQLEAYSGFYLDQGAGFQYKGQDLTAHYQSLVQQSAALPGVTCHPGVPKPALAQRFRRAAMLCYPTIYRETSCHVALEAMAAGCMVSATTVGALPETTAGYGYLTPAAQESFDPTNFIKNTLRALEERDRQPQETERSLRAAVEHVNRSHAPAVIGKLWREFLETEIRRGGRGAQREAGAKGARGPLPSGRPA